MEFRAKKELLCIGQGTSGADQCPLFGVERCPLLGGSKCISSMAKSIEDKSAVHFLEGPLLEVLLMPLHSTRMGLRKRSKFFTADGRRLYYIGRKRGEKPRLMVESAEERRRIISSIHD